MNFRTLGRALAAPEGVTMPLQDPAGMPFFAHQDRKTKVWTLRTDASAEGADSFPVTLQVVSKDAEAFRRAGQAIADSMRKLKDVTAAKAEAEAMKLVASAIVGWSHVIWNDDPEAPAEKNYLLPFSHENALRFIADYRPAMEQVDAFCADRANFQRSASSN